MDELDFSIVRQLMHPHAFQWNVRLSYAEIGRVVGADEETVRQRVKRMEKDGVVRGWQVVVNPRLFQRTWIRFDLPPVPSEARGKVEAALCAMDGAHLVLESLGSKLALVAYQAEGAAADRTAALLAAIAGGAPRVVVTQVPPATVTLSPLDWRIVQAIRLNPRAPYAEIASRAGASERTLRRRVDRMIEGRALVHDVDVDVSRIGGGTSATIHVAFAPDAPRAQVVGLLREIPRVLFSELEAPRVRVSFVASNVPEAEAIRRRIEDVARGRAEVSLEFLLRRVCLRSWLDSEIALRVGG